MALINLGPLAIFLVRAAALQRTKNPEAAHQEIRDAELITSALELAVTPTVVAVRLGNASVLDERTHTIPTFTTFPSSIEENEDGLTTASPSALNGQVDFDEWLNLDIYENEESPPNFNFYDYQIIEVPMSFPTSISEIPGFPNASSHMCNSSRFSSGVPGHDEAEAGCDIAFSTDHTTDSGNDRPGSCLAEVEPSRKRLWSDTVDADTDLSTECPVVPFPFALFDPVLNSQNQHDLPPLVTASVNAHRQHFRDTNRDIDNPDNLESTANSFLSWNRDWRAWSKNRRADGESNSEYARPFWESAGPFASLGLGAAAILELQTEDRRRKRQKDISLRHETAQPTDTEVDDEQYDILLQPETRHISQEQLVAEVKGIYAGLVMVEAKCIEADIKSGNFGPQDLDRYRALQRDEDEDSSDCEDWAGVARRWYATEVENSRSRKGDVLQTSRSQQDSDGNDSWSAGSGLSDTFRRASSQTSTRAKGTTLSSFPNRTKCSHFPPPKNICPHCNTSFRRPCDLKKHTRYHVKPISCSECTHSFGTRRDLIRHQKAVHKDVYQAERWVCMHEECVAKGFVFGRKDNLGRHVKMVHGVGEEDGDGV